MPQNITPLYFDSFRRYARVLKSVDQAAASLWLPYGLVLYNPMLCGLGEVYHLIANGDNKLISFAYFAELIEIK